MPTFLRAREMLTLAAVLTFAAPRSSAATACDERALFGVPTSWITGPGPLYIAVADFDEDGRPDLAVANGASAGTAVLLGLGNGAFQPPTFLPSGNSTSVAADDFNGDGVLDLAIGTATGTDEGNMRVFVGIGSDGVGNGEFWMESTYSVAADIYQILTLKVDGDGQRDAIASSYLRNFISLFPGQCVPDTRPPVLTDVRDVPNDQGGRVFVTWTASSLDVTGGAVNSYRVWRRVPEALLAAALTGGMPESWRTFPSIAGAATTVYWEPIATLPAQRL